MESSDYISQIVRTSLLGIALSFIIVPYGTTLVAQDALKSTLGQSDFETDNQVLQMVSGETIAENCGKKIATPSYWIGPILPAPPEDDGGGNSEDSDGDGIPDSTDVCPSEADHEECLSEYFIMTVFTDAVDSLRKVTVALDALGAYIDLKIEAGLPPDRNFFPNQWREWRERWDYEIQPQLDEIKAALDFELDRNDIYDSIYTCRDLEKYENLVNIIAGVLAGLTIVVAGLGFLSLIPPFTPIAPILLTAGAALAVASGAIWIFSLGISRARIGQCGSGR